MGEEMKTQYLIEKFSIEEYHRFIQSKQAPMHRVTGRMVETVEVSKTDNGQSTEISKHLFDYQDFITRLALTRERFAVFADVGLGKTAIFLEWCRHVSKRGVRKKWYLFKLLPLLRREHFTSHSQTQKPSTDGV